MDMKKFQIELWEALQRNDAEEAIKLINESVMNVVDENGFTFLHVSAFNGDLGLLKALIKAGADVNASDNDGRTPLHHAAFNGELGLLKALLKAGACVNAKANNGATPLHISALNEKIGSFKALIKAGADVNAAIPSALATPMHFSVLAKDIGMVKALIKAGADVNAKDVDGHTPATLALMEGEMDIFSIIQNHEAEVEKAKLQTTIPPAKAQVIKRDEKAYI